jgi:hypothetical protein
MKKSQEFSYATSTFTMFNASNASDWRMHLPRIDGTRGLETLIVMVGNH